MITVAAVVAVSSFAFCVMLWLRGSRSRWLDTPPTPRRPINDNRGDRR